MTVLAALLAALAVAVAIPDRAAAVERLPRRHGSARPARAGLSSSGACLIAGFAVAFVVGFPAGVVVGAAVAACGPAALSRLEPASVRRDRDRLVLDLPLALDLLAACLTGGASLAAAAGAVATAVPGPCGARLSGVRDALAAGTPPGEAWLSLAR
ncbi:MAG: type secretion system protein, partial [Frankiales bacterium]|nr:type secretion system protein [Frankiales bacterium]